MSMWKAVLISEAFKRVLSWFALKKEPKCKKCPHDVASHTASGICMLCTCGMERFDDALRNREAVNFERSREGQRQREQQRAKERSERVASAVRRKHITTYLDEVTPVVPPHVWDEPTRASSPNTDSSGGYEGGGGSFGGAGASASYDSGSSSSSSDCGSSSSDSGGGGSCSGGSD